MKKITAVISSLVIFISSFAFSSSAMGNAQFQNHTRTGSLLLSDSGGENILYEANASQVRSMGSITKIMTYIVTVENVQDLQTKVKIDKNVFSSIEAAASVANISKFDGKELSVYDLLCGLMIPSGCDAAMVLGNFVGNGSISGFVELMNRKAKELGCNDTKYFDPHGLSPDNRTTAYDTLKIYSYALNLPYFREITGKVSYDLGGEGNCMIYHTNYLINDNDAYCYPYCTGGKTGFLSVAGKCLATTAKKGENEYICIALGGEYNANSGFVNYAMVDTSNLYKWAFDNFTDNVYVNIPYTQFSLNVGEKQKVDCFVNSNSLVFDKNVVWSSSDESVVSVSSEGIITGVSYGNATVTATSSTGNADKLEVSCGLYRGISVSSRNGNNAMGKTGSIDWEKVKSSGIDFALVRAGWTNAQDDSFVSSVKGAVENGVKLGITYATYADNEEQAKKDAEYVIKIIENNASDYADKIVFPILYDLITDPANRTRSADILLKNINVFCDTIESKGYRAGVLFDEASLERIFGSDIDEAGADSQKLSVMLKKDGKFVPYMWNYDFNGYIEGAVRDDSKRTYEIQSLMSELSEKDFSFKLDGKSKEKATVNLDWETGDNCELLTGWRIYKACGESGMSFTAFVKADTLSFTDTRVKPGEKYTYTVVPVFEDETGDESERLDFSQSICVKASYGKGIKGLIERIRSK